MLGVDFEIEDGGWCVNLGAGVSAIGYMDDWKVCQSVVVLVVAVVGNASPA